MKEIRTVKVVDIENAIDRSWVGQTCSLVIRPGHGQQHHEMWCELTMTGQSASMRVSNVTCNNKMLRVTNEAGEIFVFEVSKEDKYETVSSNWVGDWYTEIERQVSTGKQWLIIDSPGINKKKRIRLDSPAQDLIDLFESLVRTRTGLFPPQTFAVGEYIQEEMNERGWSLEETARRCDITEQALVEVLEGWQPINPGMAICLGEAFGVSAELFLNLQKSCKSS